MTDETSTETVEDSGTDEANGPKQLREALKRSQEREAQFRGQLMERAYTEAGLDPAKGLGKAIAKEYDGEPTTDALLAYAKEEYGHEPTVKPENDLQPEITKGQKVVDDVQTISSSQESSTDKERLKKAEAEGDLAVAGDIKAKQLRKLFNP